MPTNRIFWRLYSFLNKYRTHTLSASITPPKTLKRVGRPFLRKHASLWGGLLTGLTILAVCISWAYQPDIGIYKNTAFAAKLHSLGLTVEDWQIETIGSTLEDTGLYTSLAFDASGNPGIAYYDKTNGSLKYARLIGITWEDTAVDVSGNVGMSASLAFDPSSGYPSIAYYDNDNGALKFAQFNGLLWNITTVDSAGNAGGHCSLAFDASANPAIAYLFSDAGYTGIKLARFNGTLWGITTIEYSGGYFYPVSLAFDASGNPDVAYHVLTLSPNSSQLIYNHFNGTAWVKTYVDNSSFSGGKYISLTFDLSGNPAISYLGNDLFTPAPYLMFARFDGAIWHKTPIETTITVNQTTMSSVEHSTSLAFDALGNPAISYIGMTVEDDGDLKFALFDGAAWNISTVDSVGNAGWYNSLAFDPLSGNPAISYYDGTNGNLKYAHFGQATTTSTTTTTTTPTTTTTVPCSTGNTAIAAHDINLTSYCDPGNPNPATPVDALIILGLAVGSITPDMLQPALTPAAAAIIGDGNGNGTLESVDALIALGVAVGSIPPVAPDPRCVPSSDISGVCP